MRYAPALALPMASLVPLAAQADALLFPYIATSDTVATIVSVVNQTNSNQLFLQYFYKQNLNHTAACDTTGRRPIDSGQNDLVSFAANGEFQGDNGVPGGPLFNDPAINVDYGNTSSNFTMGPLTGPRRALLIVDDGDDDNEERLYGEAIVLETLGGAAWGYRAFNAADDDDESPNFGSSRDGGGTNDVLGEVLDEEEHAPVTLLPGSEWTTRFFVTPVAAGNQRGCTSCGVFFRLSDLFDRDGNPLPDTNQVMVNCVSGVDLDVDLLPASSPALTQGGWGFARVRGGVSAAVVIKLEFNKPGTNFISPRPTNSFVGTVNNAVWLHDTDSDEGTSGLEPQ